MNIRALTLFLSLGLAGCPVHVPEPRLACDDPIPAGIVECFDDAWMDRVACWSEVTGEDSFSGYFSDIYDRPQIAKWKGLWEPWIACGEWFDDQLGDCVGVAPRIETPEVWVADPYKRCLEPPKNHWGHPVERSCLTVEGETWSWCISDVTARARAFGSTHSSAETREMWLAGVGVCRDAHYVRQESCVDEEDFRQEDCFINISDISICQ